jgi:predicted regulator of Ras-like GTPase activity (Roadblock/LC7/MglB family)
VRRSAFDTLAGENGVRAAVVVDPQGQVVLSRAAKPGSEDALAAFAAALGSGIADVAKIAGHPLPASWVLTAEQGQVLSFHRDNGFAVVALADTTVRPAMLELRARQALIDLGAT